MRREQAKAEQRQDNESDRDIRPEEPVETIARDDDANGERGAASQPSPHPKIDAPHLYPALVGPMSNMLSTKWRMPKQHDSPRL